MSKVYEFGAFVSVSAGSPEEAAELADDEISWVNNEGNICISLDDKEPRVVGEDEDEDE